MPFDWGEYLALAEALAQGRTPTNQEAVLRSVISRAYYAAYCYARNHARDLQGFAPDATGDDHQRVRDHYRSCGMNDVARKLTQLRQWRNGCDYLDTVYNLPFVSSQALIQAQDIFTSLSKQDGGSAVP